MATIILTLNRGSSSFKFALFRAGRGEPRLLARGAAEDIGGATGRIWLQDAGGALLEQRGRKFRNAAAVPGAIFLALGRHGLPAPTAVGHRLVHGGARYLRPVRLTAAVRARLKQAVPFAPLHLPAELAAIAAVTKVFPALPQVAVFDTAFHAAMPERARQLPLPAAMLGRGVHRYGFHGLSYEYLVHRLGAKRLGRAVLAHLGSGASLTAVDHGRPLDTTMGFTPAGGILMATRSGDLDPGVVVHWLRQSRKGADELEGIVNHQSGLTAIAGHGGDLRQLLARRRQDPRARLALEMFCDRVRQQIGAFTTVLGGIDSLVFTGGVGEHLAPVREAICAQLGHLGVRLDRRRNARHAGVISAAAGPCTIFVVPADEDLMIARHTAVAVRRRMGR
ncbi:acetate/propionate family kinase [Opitutus sp. GAS368]|uniref:acetate/propionate family kinase n=1 Tax=Opitutus sp. GAS368 TaxID=1882749 RepID=UPI00087BFEAD|nr:acetate/propionate family kinase [Opitutus sp. GAS368]SDR75668.1 acetate kinase [Opitutus sp. GAS368]